MFCSEEAEGREVNWLAQQMRDVGDAAAKMKQVFISLFFSPCAARQHRWSETLWSPQASESLMIVDKQPFIAIAKDRIF